ncbi:hypothetical protein TVAG_058510 [Trichomonas vaginalis G3]|uniref:Uncharacterized protein n=1 Tax=Trichomonas vaginalis (strain ATCC PRA-98 / G3) TaxID=412133 RepID=A2EQB1_TRIV3|nr:armadillo (ARM) repeat-containing protein family [Trichomonas vaginalis G3]EAY05194.1 hypothetical protein TVAG_058510 [Trichomonas vaginalis G3]KAI5522964.1 armadillo (ARM) repeat-containing protein family [Trichomonas vaginalis G3]|eukprot:XP_001317417.1 hypothetical protein [Trichomonas vaginalis G3]
MNPSQENTLNIIYQGLHSTYPSIKSACCAFLFNYFKLEGEIQYLNVDEIILLLDSEPFVIGDFSCAIFCLQTYLHKTEVDLDFIANLKGKLESKYGGQYIQNALIITLIFEIMNSQQISLDILVDPSKMDAFAWLERGIQYSNDEIRMGALALCEKLFAMAESDSQLKEMRQMFFDKSINDYLDEFENEENDPELSERLDLFKSKYFNDSDNEA